MKNNILKMFLFLFTLFLITSCEGVFEYSPYEAIVREGYKNTTQKNLDRINAITVNDTTFKFAIISDSHNKYDELKAALISINNNPKISFVLHTGDLTTLGILLEYELFHDIMNELKVPYFTVIGNHDSRSNGPDIYSDMFGIHNYSFVFNNSKFVLFDDVMWEVEKTLDSSWLKKELSSGSNYNFKFVVSHIPPFSDVFDTLDEISYKNIMIDYKVRLSIHGHLHKYLVFKPYNDGMEYLIIPNIDPKSYVIVTVNKNSLTFEKVDY